MIKLLNLLIEEITDWEFGYERPFRFDLNSTVNEGRFRLYHPDDLDSYFRTKTHPWTKEVIEGVSYVMGKRKDNRKLTIQAIRFNKGYWNEDQAKNWFNDNKKNFRFNIGQIDEGLNLPKKKLDTPEDWFKNLLTDLEINKQFDDIFFFNISDHDREYMAYFVSEKELLVSNIKIWSVLRKKYQLSTKEIRQLVKNKIEGEFGIDIDSVFCGIGSYRR